MDIRHFGVIAEGLRADIRLLGEGRQALQEEFRSELEEFRLETRAEFQDVKAGIRALEREAGDLRSRVERIEMAMDR